MHQITFKKQVIKALRAMPPREAKRIRDQLSKLAEDPGRRDVDVVELKDRPGSRLRVGGRRVISSAMIQRAGSTFCASVRAAMSMGTEARQQEEGEATGCNSD